MSDLLWSFYSVFFNFRFCYSFWNIIWKNREKLWKLRQRRRKRRAFSRTRISESSSRSILSREGFNRWWQSDTSRFSDASFSFSVFLPFCTTLCGWSGFLCSNPNHLSIVSFPTTVSRLAFRWWLSLSFFPDWLRILNFWWSWSDENEQSAGHRHIRRNLCR